VFHGFGRDAEFFEELEKGLMVVHWVMVY
jgi:hypothetical protein